MILKNAPTDKKQTVTKQDDTIEESMAMFGHILHVCELITRRRPPSQLGKDFKTGLARRHQQQLPVKQDQRQHSSEQKQQQCVTEHQKLGQLLTEQEQQKHSTEQQQPHKTPEQQQPCEEIQTCPPSQQQSSTRLPDQLGKTGLEEACAKKTKRRSWSRRLISWFGKPFKRNNANDHRNTRESGAGGRGGIGASSKANDSDITRIRGGGVIDGSGCGGTGPCGSKSCCGGAGGCGASGNTSTGGWPSGGGACGPRNSGQNRRNSGDYSSSPLPEKRHQRLRFFAKERAAKKLDA
jgi:hypothetical protein